jgi:hypothetical protein
MSNRQISVDIADLHDIYIATHDAQHHLARSERHSMSEGVQGIERTSAILDYIQEKVAKTISDRHRGSTCFSCHDTRCEKRSLTFDRNQSQTFGAPAEEIVRPT